MHSRALHLQHRTKMVRLLKRTSNNALRKLRLVRQMPRGLVVLQRCWGNGVHRVLCALLRQHVC